MTVAQATIVKRIRKRLDDEPWETQITGTILSTDLTVGVPDGTQFAEGDIIEHTSGEQARVVSVSVNVLTIKRGHNDTTAVGWSSGSVILKNPEYAFDEITNAVNSIFLGLWPNAWKSASTTLTAVASKRYYDLPTDFVDLISVVQDITSTAGQYRVLEYGTRGSGYPVAVKTGLPVTVAASGQALYFPQVRTTPTTALVVVYRATFAGTVSGGNYTEINDGLPAEVLVDGACFRLLEDAEIERVKDAVDQGDEAVSPGARLRDAAYFEQRYEAKLNQWHLMLKRTAPPAGVWR